VQSHTHTPFACSSLRTAPVCRTSLRLEQCSSRKRRSVFGSMLHCESSAAGKNSMPTGMQPSASKASTTSRRSSRRSSYVELTNTWWRLSIPSYPKPRTKIRRQMKLRSAAPSESQRREGRLPLARRRIWPSPATNIQGFLEMDHSQRKISYNTRRRRKPSHEICTRLYVSGA
jgi:hypothetical protein